MTNARPAARLLPIARMAAGPLALIAFLLPWAHGPGPLAEESYTGLDLVRLTGVLQGLELPMGQAIILLAARAALVAMPVAAAWLTLLAPAHRWHPGYAAAASYLITVTAVVAATGLLRAGLALPMPGPALLLASSAMLLAPRLPGPRLRIAVLKVSRRQGIPQV